MSLLSNDETIILSTITASYLTNTKFLIHFAEKVGTKDLNKIVKNIEEITDPCIVIYNLFKMECSDDVD